MKICICRDLSDKDFRENLKIYEGESIRTDFCSLEDFHMDCSGCGTACGKCLSTIRDEIIEPHNNIVSQIQQMANNAAPADIEQEIKEIKEAV